MYTVHKGDERLQARLVLHIMIFSPSVHTTSALQCHLVAKTRRKQENMICGQNLASLAMVCT